MKIVECKVAIPLLVTITGPKLSEVSDIEADVKKTMPLYGFKLQT